MDIHLEHWKNCLALHVFPFSRWFYVDLFTVSYAHIRVHTHTRIGGVDRKSRSVSLVNLAIRLDHAVGSERTPTSVCGVGEGGLLEVKQHPATAVNTEM